MPAAADTCYILDHDDHIVEVEGDWSMLHESTLGQPIWRYVRDGALRSIYSQLYDKARRGRSLEFPYRCDTPTHRCRMQMRIEPRDARCLQVSSTVLEALPRAEPLAVVGVSRGHEIALRCSVCNRFGRAGAWIDLIHAVETHAWLDTDRPVRVHYGVCPTCRTELRAV